jgi:hypothetical protein
VAQGFEKVETKTNCNVMAAPMASCEFGFCCGQMKE